jgi:predicted dehydrogenase
VRTGLVGCGWAGALRAAAVARLPGFRLVAVTDQDAARARALAYSRSAQAHLDWPSLVRRDDLDLVIVSTPPSGHAEICIAALEHGKTVLCEKPLARTPAECRQILEASRRHGRLVATGFNYRFYPAIMKMREVLDSGLIGELDHVRSYAGHPGGREFTHAWVHDVDVMGGGTLLDNGIHLVDLTRYVLGEVAEVQGYATANVWGFRGCEDNGFALLRSPAGKVAALHSSWSEWRGYRFAVEVYGTRGCVRASYPPMMTEVVRVDPARARPLSSRYLFPWFQLIERLRSPRWTALESFTRELAAVERAQRGERTALALGLDGLRAVQIAHGVYRSSTQGAPIRLEEC